MSQLVQCLAIWRSPGLVNVVPAVAYRFCLALRAAFTQPWDHLPADLCTFWSQPQRRPRFHNELRWGGSGHSINVACLPRSTLAEVVSLCPTLKCRQHIYASAGLILLGKESWISVFVAEWATLLKLYGGDWLQWLMSCYGSDLRFWIAHIIILRQAGVELFTKIDWIVFNIFGPSTHL